MPIDPSIPLQGRPAEINMAAAATQGMQLQAARQAARQQAIQTQQAELDMKDQELMREAYGQAGGDLGKLKQLVAGKVSPRAVMMLDQAILERQQKLAQLNEKQLAVAATRMKMLAGAGATLLQQPPEQRAASWGQLRGSLIQSGAASDQELPAEYPGDQWLQMQVGMTQSAADVFKAEYDRREEERKAQMQGPSLAKAQADAQLAQATAAGNAPIQPKDRQPTGELREFREVFYPGYLQEKGISAPNARTEMEALLEFKKRAAQRAPVPGVDVPLPKDVEAQRTRMNASRAQQNGVSPQQLSQVNSLAARLDAHPVVKAFNETTNKLDTVRSILDGKLGGAGDLAVVYEFMRGLDPTSVVRESEFSAAAKSGNIFAGAFAKFNGYLKPEGGFLPEQVKSAFLAILQKKLDASTNQVRALHKDYARRADRIIGKPGAGAEYLTDYATLYSGAPEGGEDLTKLSTEELLRRVNGK